MAGTCRAVGVLAAVAGLMTAEIGWAQQARRGPQGNLAETCRQASFEASPRGERRFRTVEDRERHIQCCVENGGNARAC